jgi:hypothetical protein
MNPYSARLGRDPRASSSRGDATAELPTRESRRRNGPRRRVSTSNRSRYTAGITSRAVSRGSGDSTRQCPQRAIGMTVKRTCSATRQPERTKGPPPSGRCRPSRTLSYGRESGQAEQVESGGSLAVDSTSLLAEELNPYGAALEHPGRDVSSAPICRADVHDLSDSWLDHLVRADAFEGPVQPCRLT